MSAVLSTEYETQNPASIDPSRRRCFEAQEIAIVDDLTSPNRRRADRQAIRENCDAGWGSANLRWRNGDVLLDLANVLRVFERHPNFRGRFVYDQATGKVADRGVVMSGWQIDAMAAEIQERFLPAVCEQTVSKALNIAANRAQDPRNTGNSMDCV